jgi:hydrogenase-4 component B
MNGFAGKWLIYLSLMRDGFAATGIHSVAALLAVGGLGLIGGLAALTFVRLTGIALLGTPRSGDSRQARESSPWMIGPMLILVVLCVGAAMAPHFVADLLSGVVDPICRWETGRALRELETTETPLPIVGNINAWLLIVGGTLLLFMFAWLRQRDFVPGPTWGCGYAKPTATMQYTGRSFAELIAEHLLPRFLRPHKKHQAPHGLFPTQSTFAAECPDPVSENVYEPFFRRWANRFARLRILQQGKIHIYLIYIFFSVVLALAWISIRQWWGVS